MPELPRVEMIAATIHGRYLVRPGRGSLLVGFHGYAESADAQLDRLAMIPGVDEWTLVAVQALHRFYRRRSDEVVASWMTRQDRELMIADNIEYVRAVVEQVEHSQSPPSRIVLAGFSQGVSMAFRAGSASVSPSAVVACGGDIPPELTPEQLRNAGRVLLGRGEQDELYTAAVMDRDVLRLRDAGVEVVPVTVPGGHDWNAAFAAGVGAFIAGLS